MKLHRRQDQEGEINITPMMDIVFIMLIFFIVTTSFVKERGLDIARPTQSPIETVLPAPPIVLKVDAMNSIVMGERVIQRDTLRANLSRANASQPEAVLLIAAHSDSTTDTLVAILDAANLVGIESISVAKL